MFETNEKIDILVTDQLWYELYSYLKTLLIYFVMYNSDHEPCSICGWFTMNYQNNYIDLFPIKYTKNFKLFKQNLLRLSDLGINCLFLYHGFDNVYFLHVLVISIKSYQE